MRARDLRASLNATTTDAEGVVSIRFLSLDQVSAPVADADASVAEPCSRSACSCRSSGYLAEFFLQDGASALS